MRYRKLAALAIVAGGMAMLAACLTTFGQGSRKAERPGAFPLMAQLSRFTATAVQILDDPGIPE